MYYIQIKNYEIKQYLRQILHFFGQLLICQKFNNKGAFLIAKSNVEKHLYSVVGITEHIQEKLTVMEARLPLLEDMRLTLIIRLSRGTTSSRYLSYNVP